MSADPRAEFEVVIGLEVHAQLATASKLFSPAPVTFGLPANHAVHAIDIALPGVLPVLNARAVELAMRAALATDCTVHPHSVFARKNYFYPDLPKGYQISQYEEPLATGGRLEIEAPGEDGRPRTRSIGITRIHMEEDAGKSIHDAAVAGDEDTHVDLNRSGVPLIEIVSEPDLRSPEEAGAYLRTLREILRYTQVSDADMEKGQFRCDANVSLRRRGETRLGTRTELKNLNSFRFVEDALRAEILRQAQVLGSGGTIVQATMRYETGTSRTVVMRVKENADDYRYFPDPDLIPLVIDPEKVAAVRAALPELPEKKRARFVASYGLSEYDTRLLTASRALADFFEEAARRHGTAKTVANWMLRDLLQVLKERELELERAAIEPAALARLIALVETGRVTSANARELLPELVERGGDPERWIRERGLEAVSDTGVLDAAADAAIAANPKVVARYHEGDVKVLNFLLGQVMKQTQGKADPAAVREILLRKLGR
jgi:aspartyl-tRNA(Asn)/glutamyl-tRNA(Gln) amidotransferase subunit B